MTCRSVARVLHVFLNLKLLNSSSSHRCYDVKMLRDHHGVGRAAQYALSLLEEERDISLWNGVKGSDKG